MDLPALRYFVAAAHAGGFTRAAHRCGITQPALSQQIGKLEEQLGRPLFDRLGRRVVLTDSGRRLLEHAEPLLAAADDAERAVRESDPASGGRVSIGAIPTVAASLLPRILREFVRAHPAVEFRVREEVTDALVDRTERGELDLAIVSLPLSRPRLRVEALIDEPLVLAMARDHRLAKRKRIRVEDLRDESFILLHPEQRLGHQVLEYCRRHGFEPRLAGQASQLATVQTLVAMGLGVSLVPEMTSVAERSKRLAYHAAPGDAPRRLIGIIQHKHRYRPPVVNAFVDRLHATMAQSG